MLNNEQAKHVILSLKMDNNKQTAKAMQELEAQVKQLEESLRLVKEALASKNENALEIVAHRPGSLADEAARVDITLGNIATLNHTKEALDCNLEQIGE